MKTGHYAFYDPRSALGRVSVSALVAIATAILARAHFAWQIALLAGWNAGGFVLGALAWRNINRCDSKDTHARAASDDPGRNAVYALVVLTSAASLLAATVLVRHAHDVGTADTALMIALCLTTVTLSWSLTHTAFTLRYAHLYYREDAEGVGGIDFPGGGHPCYTDFAYLSFTVGMCFQVSDVAVTSRQIRTTVLVQAALSFFYNSAILAFVLNLVFGHAG